MVSGKNKNNNVSIHFFSFQNKNIYLIQKKCDH